MLAIPQQGPPMHGQGSGLDRRQVHQPAVNHQRLVTRRQSAHRPCRGPAERIPLPDRPDIHMNEIVGRVVADAPAPGRQRGTVKFHQWAAGNPEVDGLAAHMKTVDRDAFIAESQHGIGVR